MATFRFEAALHVEQDGGAYVIVPIDIRQTFGKGRVKVKALFDGIPYEGSVVNMGLRDENGSVCYVLGVRKAIREALGKSHGDRLRVELETEESPRNALV